MNTATKLISQVFTTVIYESVVGSIVIENEILCDGSLSTSMFVKYPDGVSEEIFTVNEGCEKLEV
jgi:hypothetical protein